MAALLGVDGVIRRKLAGENVREGPLEEVALPWREPCRDGAGQRERQVKSWGPG